MTEYDYSPDAVERYMENQNRVAGWVSGQAYEAPRYKDPFNATPSVATTQLPPDRHKSHTRSRSHSHSSSRHQSSSRSRTSSHSRSSSATFFVPQNPPPMPVVSPVPLTRQPTRSYTTPVQGSPMPVYPTPHRSHSYDIRPHTAQGFHHHPAGIQPNTVYFPGGPYHAQASSPHIAYQHQRNEPVVIPASSYIIIPNSRDPIIYSRGSPTSPKKGGDSLLKRVLGSITWSSNKSSSQQSQSGGRSRSKSRSRRHSIGH